MNHALYYSRHTSIPRRRKPVREDVCKVYVGFQGVTFPSSQYGDIPAFGPETTGLNWQDYKDYVQYFKALGFTHIEFAVSWNYQERDYQYPVPGIDCTENPNFSILKERMTYAIDQGMFCVLFLAGDGMSLPRNTDGTYPYNDPVGWTYGFEWLMDNIARIRLWLSDIEPWIVYSPAYDAAFYGWGTDPAARVVEFGKKFRSINPVGNLAIEHDVGHIPVGEGVGDYSPGGRMEDYDVILGEFDQNNLHGDNVWQILGRMCRPYNRPSDQPAGDDPNPPMYLQPCSRGPRFYIIYEFGTFPWVRNLVTALQVILNGQYLKSIAPDNIVCCYGDGEP